MWSMVIVTASSIVALLPAKGQAQLCHDGAAERGREPGYFQQRLVEGCSLGRVCVTHIDGPTQVKLGRDEGLARCLVCSVYERERDEHHRPTLHISVIAHAGAPLRSGTTAPVAACGE